MSVVNLHVSPERVWLACDTVQFMDGEPHSFATKCSLLPHLWTVVGFRGLVVLHRRVDFWMNGTPLDVVDAVERLPEQLCGWRAELQERWPDHDHVKGQIWIAGWHPAEKGFAAWCLDSEADFVPRALPVPGTWINPPNGLVDPPQELATPDILVRVVEAQRQMSEANLEAGGTDLGIGGEILLLELTRQNLTVRKAHRFDNYASIKERIRARR